MSRNFEKPFSVNLLVILLMASILFSSCKETKLIVNGPGLIKTEPTPEPTPEPENTIYDHNFFFSTSAAFQFDANTVEVSSGAARLKGMDQTHSGSDFLAGTHSGTTVVSGHLVLDSGATDHALSSSWTPQFTDLVGHWKMDNNWEDSSGNNNHGTAADNAGFVASAKVGTHAGNFDGAGDSVSVPHSASLSLTTAATVMGWVHIDNYTVFDSILMKTTNSTWTDGYGLYMGSAWDLCFFIRNYGSVKACAPIRPLLKGWHHVVGTYDGTSLKIYIDGDLKHTEPYVGVINTNTEALYLGDAAGLAYSMDGKLDEVAIWRVRLTGDEVRTIYHRQKQKYYGQYESAVMDATVNSTWDSFTTVTANPFSSELTGTEVGLIGLWHLNETAWAGVAGEVIDHSPLGNHGQSFGGSTTETGLFGRGGYFDGLDDYVNLNSQISFADSDEFTISFWYRGNDLDQNGVYGKTLLGRDSLDIWANLIIREGYVAYLHYDGGWQMNVKSSTMVADGDWHHVVLVNHSNKTADLYIDGVREVTGASSVMDDSTFPFRIDGFMKGYTGVYTKGALDEVSIWSRSFNSSEVLQLYRSGANRIRYEVRSCDDVACVGESWTPLADPLSLPDNRFFQYRVSMEAEDNTLCSGSPCLPELTSVDVGPGHYFGMAPSITNISGISFSSVLSFAAIAGGECTVRYQLSSDGVNFFYWDGLSWLPATDSVLETSTEDELNTNLSTLEVLQRPGLFFFRAYLPSDTTQSCELSVVSIQYK